MVNAYKPGDKFHPSVSGCCAEFLQKEEEIRNHKSSSTAAAGPQESEPAPDPVEGWMVSGQETVLC